MANNITAGLEKLFSFGDTKWINVFQELIYYSLEEILKFLRWKIIQVDKSWISCLRKKFDKGVLISKVYILPNESKNWPKIEVV